MWLYPGAVNLLTIPGVVGAILWWVLAAVKLFALITALMFSAAAYRAADKWSKQGWVILLAVAFVLQVVPVPILFLNLAMTIAALVFLADVRPALSSLRRR